MKQLISALLALLLLTCGALAEVGEPVPSFRGSETEAAAIELEIGEVPEFELSGKALPQEPAASDAYVSAPGEDPAAESVPKGIVVNVPIDAAHFPDSGFRALLSSTVDLNHNGVLSSVEREGYTDLRADGITRGNHIEDLTGIAYFPNLEILICINTGLKTVDISKNAKLRSVNLAGNPLTGTVKLKNKNTTVLTLSGIENLDRLDFSGCTALTFLDCRNSGLTKLDTSAMPDLQTLECAENNITSLDLRQNKDLRKLSCSYNHELSKLSICPGAPLHTLFCDGTKLKSLNLKGCENLSSLECVDTPSLHRLDISGCTRLLKAVKENEASASESSDRVRFYRKESNIQDLYTQLSMPATCTLTANGAVLYAATKDIAGCVITTGDVAYTGKRLKPVPKVKYDGTALKKGVDFTLSYKNNIKVGYATVIVKGKGNYGGEAEATFRILPKATTIKKVTGGKGKLTAQWRKVSGVAGYQVEVSRNKKFEGSLKKMFSGAKTTKKTIGKLKTKGIYYVRVRAYHKISGEYFWSAWSKTKKVRVK